VYINNEKEIMEIKEITISEIEVSEFNTRKDLADGQIDSTIEDLARSIEKQGLLSPITVYQKENGKFALIAGQRRLLACKYLGWSAISAIVRDNMSTADATAISLVENVHRADMNPHDKAIAFKTLLDNLGDLSNVSRETGVGVTTIKKYIQLLGLATVLQEQLAAGETKNTQALANLAQKIQEPEGQVKVWGQIQGFTQSIQQEIIKNLDPDLSNLKGLKDKATEGAFDYKMVRNCPYDCPTIPVAMKEQVAEMIKWYNTAGKDQLLKK
jgi:ParB family chromosome partitioning protein